MKTRAMFVLIAVMAGSLSVSPAFAQRRAASGGRRSVQTNPENSPSTPIQPVTSAPVQPFVNYLRVPATTPPARSVTSPQFRGDRDRRAPIVVVGGGFYGYPFGGSFDPFAYAPFLTPAPVPGQLPYTYPLPLYSPAPVPGQLPNTYALLPTDDQLSAVYALPAAANMGDPVYYPEPQIIIPADSPEPIKETPALGATRAEVEAKYGEPWGVVAMRGKETLYYRSGLVVVYDGGRVAEVQKR